MLTPNQDYIKELVNLVRQSPFPKHMSIELSKIEYDKSLISISLSRYHFQPFGIVHGGVLASLIDTATFWSAYLRLPQDTGLVNVDLKLNYLRPVTGGKLRAEGTCIKPGNTLSYSEARVIDDNDKIIAHGTSTLMALPGKGLNLKNKKFL